MSVFVNDGGIEKEAKMIYVNDGGIDKLVAGGRDPTPPIGSPFEGGFIVDVVTAPDGVFAVILADISAEQSLLWKTTVTASPGTTSEDDGWANTIAMADENHPAANYCRSYRGGGFDDWFLLATNQLARLQLTIPPRGVDTPADFKEGGAQAMIRRYWTSTQSSTTNAFTRSPLLEFQSSSVSKMGSNTVRPARIVMI